MNKEDLEKAYRLEHDKAYNLGNEKRKIEDRLEEVRRALDDLKNQDREFFVSLIRHLTSKEAIFDENGRIERGWVNLSNIENRGPYLK